MSDAIDKRAGLAKAGYGAVNDFGIYAADTFVVNLQPFNHTGPEAFQHNVCILNQLIKNLSAFSGFEVERHVFLIAIYRVEKEAIVDESATFN